MPPNVKIRKFSIIFYGAPLCNKHFYVCQWVSYFQDRPSEKPMKLVSVKMNI